MIIRLKRKFLSTIFIIGIFLLILIGLLGILFLKEFEMLILAILITIIIIYIFIFLYILNHNYQIFKLKNNITYQIKKSEYRKKNKYFTLINGLEVLFWICILFISVIFVFIHGFYLVDYSFYYNRAQLYYSILLDQKIIPDMNIFEIFIYRPLYPLLISIFSLPLTLILPIKLSFSVIGVIINLISGYIVLYYFGKITNLITANKISKRIGRLMAGTTPTFILYWSKFSTDIFFLATFTCSLFFLLKYYKIRRKRDLYLFFILMLISCFIREVGIFLLFSGIYIVFYSKKSTQRIFKIVIFLLILFLTFSLFFNKIIISRFRYRYFYDEVFPQNPDSPQFNFQNLMNWLIIMFNSYISLDFLRNIFFSSLWTFGFFLGYLFIFMISYFFNKINNNSKKNKSRLIYNLKQKLINIRKLSIKFNLRFTLSFSIPYLLFLFIMVYRVSERYFLPITILVIVSILLVSYKDNEYKKITTFLTYGIIFNILLLSFRIIMISIIG